MTGEKVNPTFRIIKKLFDVHQTVPHGNIPPQLLFLLLSAVLPYATAQQAWDPSGDRYGVNTNVNSSLAIIVVSFICVALFICMFSVFLRQCLVSRTTAAATSQRDARFRPGPAGGLNPAVIEMFPIFIYSEVKELKLGKGALECAVCLNEFKDDDSLRLIPKCDHVFHPDCIDPWLASHTTCPVCRTNLLPDYDEIIRDTTQTHDSNESPDEENPRSELSEAENQVSVTVEGDQSRDSQTLEMVNVNQTPKQTRVPRSMSTTSGRITGKFPRSTSTTSARITGKFPRSHTTGHSMVQHGESFDSYTLRLPEELREEIAMRMKQKLTTSSDAVLPREGSSRRGYRNGEGSSRWNWKWYVDRQFGRSIRFARSDRWMLPIAPPVLSKVAPIGSPERSNDGGETSAANAKTSVSGPIDCLAVKAVEAEQSSDRPPV